MSSRSPVNLKLFVNMGSKVSMFNQMANEHMERQSENPFSGWEGAATKRKLSKEDAGYGKPIAGSKTEERGKKAAAQVRAELRELCDVIFDCGVKNKDGTAVISFGRLFTVYNVISDKCVGLLMRARKHGLVTFEGEMLFQRRDDDVVITLLKPINTIRHHFGAPPIKNGGAVPTLEIPPQEKSTYLTVKNDELFVDSLPVTPDSSPNLSLRTSPEPSPSADENEENYKHFENVTSETCITPEECTANPSVVKDVAANSLNTSDNVNAECLNTNDEQNKKDNVAETSQCSDYPVCDNSQNIPITVVTLAEECLNCDNVLENTPKVTDMHDEVGDTDVVNSTCHEATSQVSPGLSLPTVQIETETHNVVSSEQETI